MNCFPPATVISQAKHLQDDELRVQMTPNSNAVCLSLKRNTLAAILDLWTNCKNQFLYWVSVCFKRFVYVMTFELRGEEEMITVQSVNPVTQSALTAEK